MNVSLICLIRGLFYQFIYYLRSVLNILWTEIENHPLFIRDHFFAGVYVKAEQVPANYGSVAGLELPDEFPADLIDRLVRFFISGIGGPVFQPDDHQSAGHRAAGPSCLSKPSSKGVSEFQSQIMIHSQLNPVSRKQRLRSVEAFSEEQFSFIDLGHVSILPAVMKFFYLFKSETCNLMTTTCTIHRKLCSKVCRQGRMWKNFHTTPLKKSLEFEA